ncbi:MAG: M56 family metallopeptidase [Vicinamibacteraceae bacterium]
MSPLFLDPALSAALWIAIKASALLAVAAVVQGLIYRRSSAATRHLVWTLAVVGVLLLPILSFALPGWAVVIRETTSAADRATAVDRVEEAADLARASAPRPATTEYDPVPRRVVSMSWPAVVAGVYAAGLLVMLMHLGIQRWSVRQLARRTSDVRDPEWMRLLTECAASMGVLRPLRLLRSRERSMPMTFGTRHPTILIPAVADTWSVDRRRAVVLHEMAHVTRYDCLTQRLAFAACALYWFHPVVWYVARRLRVERELACDDRVIAAGTPAREYAGHLLEIAYALDRHRAPALAVSMARPSQLEGRMLAVLDVARNRCVPALRARLAGTAVAAAVLLPLASATTTVDAADPQADRIPAAAVVKAVPAQHQTTAPSSMANEPLLESAQRVVRAGAAAMGVPQDELPGTWEIRPADRKGMVHLRLVEGDSSSGSTMAIAQLEGLTAAQLGGADGPVQFRLRRDAGTFTFDGVMRRGVGAGTFSFTPDPRFPEELAKRGFARPDAREQYQMARHDVGYAFLDELNAQGYAKLDTSELVRAGQHGVDVAYVKELGALGYRLGSLAPLIELRDHGVTPAFIRGLADQGYKGLSADDLRQARDHGVTPEYVRAMRDAGYASVPIDELINARDHGVTADFVRELNAAGHGKLPLDQLIAVRDHGVSPAYVQEMRQLGYALPVEGLIRARDHGVSVDFVRELAGLGYRQVPIDSLVRLRDHGVTPEYVRELTALGYKGLTVEELVTLRDHGLTPERIRTANARAGSRLPIDLLKSLAAGGMR